MTTRELLQKILWELEAAGVLIELQEEISAHLAKPEPEPVCWINMTGVENPDNDTFIVRRHNIPPHMVPLYRKDA